ncbi:MAG: DUF2953 domain-containing protein [Lachnospiraceae bacterium]|nr:DUF2953 domain-containing protein [Lachnospiraceae bacterium]
MKIIGIALAVLVGLILLIVLLLLFVPFRYKGSAKYPNTKAKAKLTWLLHLLNVSVDYDENNMIMIVRFFGFKIMSTDPEDVRKKEEKERKKQEKRKAKLKKKREKLKAKREKEKAKRKAAKEKERQKNQEQANTSAQKPSDIKDAAKKPSDKMEADKKPSENGKKEANGESASEKAAKEGKSFDDLTGDELEEMLDGEFGPASDEEKKTVVEKIKSIYNKAEGLFKKLNMYKDFEEDFRVRKAVKYIWEKVKLILKREMPKKLKGHISYGFDNPATTGYVTGLASVFIGLWDGHFEISPNFEQKELDADVDFKGRIRLIGILVPLAKVWFNKDVKYLRKEAGHLKDGSYKAPVVRNEKEE